MGVLVIDEKNLTLNMRLGVLETYKPTKEHKDLQKKVELIRSKKEALDKHYMETYEKEIAKELKEVQISVRGINETRYPELKVRREAEEAVANANKPNGKAKSSTKRKK